METEFQKALSSFVGQVNGQKAVIHFKEFRNSDLSEPSLSRAREQLGKKELIQRASDELLALGVTKEEMHMSISHSSIESCTGVLVVGSNQRVGIDLERKNRVVHEKILYRITNLKERTLFNGDVLRFWVAKEAAFKANPDNKDTLLPQYEIDAWDDRTQVGKIRQSASGFTSGFAQSQQKSWTCRFKLVETPFWVMSLAVSESHG